jgi:ribosomal protein S9
MQNGREIGIGIVGGGYMGKAHAVAMSASARCLTPACAHGWKWSPLPATPDPRRTLRALGFSARRRDWRSW